MKDSPISTENLFLFLKKVPLLAVLDDATLLEFASFCYVKKASKGQIIFRRGDPSESVYLVRSGSVMEFAGGPNELEIVVKVRHEGDYFGEMGMFIDEPQLVTSVAVSPSVLIGIPREIFLRYVWSDVRLMRYLIKVLASRLKKSGERLISHALLDARARLAYILLWLEQEEGGKGVITVTQEYIAQYCGLARQTAAGILGEWKQMNWIITSHGKIEVLDKAALVDVILESD